MGIFAHFHNNIHGLLHEKISIFFPRGALTYVPGMSAISRGNDPRRYLCHALRVGVSHPPRCWGVHGGVDKGVPGTLGCVGP